MSESSWLGMRCVILANQFRLNTQSHSRRSLAIVQAEYKYYSSSTGIGERLCKKIAKHTIWTGRMLWIV